MERIVDEIINIFENDKDYLTNLIPFIRMMEYNKEIIKWLWVHDRFNVSYIPILLQLTYLQFPYGRLIQMINLQILRDCDMEIYTEIVKECIAIHDGYEMPNHSIWLRRKFQLNVK